MAIRAFAGFIPELHESVFVDELAVVLGQVSIAEHSSVWPTATVRGDIHSISIGKYTNVQDGAVLHVTHDSRFSPGGKALVIGDFVTIGHNATLHGCTIGNYSLIGMNAVVLDGAVLEDRVMVAAHALVAPNKICESGYLYAGSPAKKIRPLSDSEQEFLSYSPQHYAKLKDQHKAESNNIES